MDINEGTTTDDLWTPYKELVSVVESYLAHESGGVPYAVHTFESVLRRHKQTFLSLLKNPAKNATSREEIMRGITKGVNLPSSNWTLLSKELVDEAIIISDMYNVNEYLALELLHTAQRQAPRYPGLPRGLLAVLLYYDGRKALAQALKHLVTARDGVCWAVSAREEVISYVSRYVGTLVADGLVEGVLDALAAFTLDAELARLRANRALPPPAYHARLTGAILATRKLLAEVVFAASAQRGLHRGLLRLITEQTTAPSLGPTGALDEVSLALQMGLLYALDLSVLHRREDGEELAKMLPLVESPELLPMLLDKLAPGNGAAPQDAEPAAVGAGAKALCQLSLGLALAALKRGPASLARRPLKLELLDQDELLVDAAIDGKVFEYIEEAMLSTEYVCREEYYQRRLHQLLTDFIVLMHSKLMEMRVKADEAARAVQMFAAEGVAPPGGAGAGRTRLDALLRCVERLYARDPAGLRHAYWAAHTADHAHRSGGRAATLYKFVRLSGEVVCAALLPAYLRALAALAVSRHTWALLARRDALSAHHLLAALQRYHANLRSEPSTFSEHQHSSLGATAILTAATRPGKLLVRHEEVEAMIAALKLIAAVAKQDEAACASICENLQWDAVNVMFGLVCCHVPIQLKAELLTTLAALGGTPGTAGRVWVALEAARLVPASPDDDKRALPAELNEVECRMEEYPLSRAFVSLLISLSGAGGVPPALGAGARAPGAAPYLHHVLHRLALPAPHRPHQPRRRWQMLSLCFRLFALWLEQYEPSPGTGAGAGAGAEPGPHPGCQLLLQLHVRSDFLRLLLTALDDACALLSRPLAEPEPGQNFVEESLESILQILERGLALERGLLAGGSGPLMLVGLSKLLLAGEGPSGGDRLLTVCRVVQLGGAVALRATSLLARALAAPHAARHLLAALAHHTALAATIRHGFVEVLEAEESADDTSARKTKEGVLRLLHQTLPGAPPTLAHFLLGYQLTPDISRSALNEPGAAGHPRTCLHSILDILDQHIAAHTHDREASELVESCYRLVYWVCARPATSAPALRYLRTRDYFLARHVRATVNLETASPVTLSSRSWVLRACACELGAAAAARQHAALAALLTALTHASHHHAEEWQWCLARRALEGLPVSVAPAAAPRWELFHAHQLHAAIAECDLPTGMGGKRISVSRVHALLSRELASLHATAPQRNLVSLEIQKVLDYVTEVNRQRNLAATLTHYYDSWRQLIEIMFCVAPPDILSHESRKNLLLNILQDLLNKIPPAEVLPQIGNLASGTVLLLLVNLRHCSIMQKRESGLDTSDFETTFFGPTNQIMQTKSLTLKFILHKILSWILVPGSSTQKMRVNLYGALLNFLNIVNLKPSAIDMEEDEGEVTYVSRLDSTKGRVGKEESALKCMVVDVIGGFGEGLCAAVCGDVTGAGHEVCRLAALAALHALLDVGARGRWLHALTGHGHLRSLVDSLLQDDAALTEALEPNPKSLRVIYVYESKMSLLLKLAGWSAGAGTVLAQGALHSVAALRALARHPDIHAPAAPALLPSPAARFRQVLVPALRLCDALLTTLGTGNHSCVLHVTHLLLSLADTADVVLRAAHPNSPLDLLIETEALTSVIARASEREVFAAVSSDTALQHSAAALQRLHALMLALLPRFAAPQPDLPQENDFLYYKIVCNLLTFARNMVEVEGTRALFRASLTGGGADAAPHVGALLQLLQALQRRAAALQRLLDTRRHQPSAAATTTTDDLSSPAACAAAEGRARTAETRRAVSCARLALAAALYLLWAHLRVYLRLAAAPTDTSLNDSALSVGAAWRGAAGELPELRKGLIAIFNDRFTDELLETAKNQPAPEHGFLEVMIKDIKGMIQYSPL